MLEFVVVGDPCWMDHSTSTISLHWVERHLIDTFRALHSILHNIVWIVMNDIICCHSTIRSD